MPPLQQTSGRGGSADPPHSDPPTFKKGWNGWWQRNDINVVIVIVIAVFVLTVMWPSIFVVIPSGHAGVYYSLLFGGTNTKMVCTEGFWLKSPWDKIYDYDIRQQLVSYDYSVISADGLPIQFKVSVRARPRLATLAYLQKDIGPDYLDKIIVPESQQAIRQVVGDNSAEKVYTTNPSALEEAFDRIIEETTGTYILVDSIMVRESRSLPLSSARSKRNSLSNKMRCNSFMCSARQDKRPSENASRPKGSGTSRTLSRPEFRRTTSGGKELRPRWISPSHPTRK